MTKILLITRADHPYVNKLALPGGFYRFDDVSVEYTASRELFEETSVCYDFSNKNLVKVSSEKGRDPRGWVISIAYKAVIDETSVKPVANSDALYASWRGISSLTEDSLAFDHYSIIRYALEEKE